MTEPGRILVIQLRRIGDILLATPAIAALKKRFSDARLDVLAEDPGAEVLEGNPHVCEVLRYDGRGLAGALSWMRRVRGRRYDWVVDFMGNPRSALLTAFSGAAVRAGPAHVFHRWAYNHPLVQSDTTHYGGIEKIRALRALGVPSEGADFLPQVYLLPRRPSPGNVVGLVPSSRRVTRRWPARHFAALGRLLRRRYSCELLVFWGPGERELADEVARGIGDGARATPETRTLKEAAALMAGCRLVVTNCNGPRHLATALGVPTVAVHGSSDPASWNPPHPRHLVVRREELSCIGCGLNACPYHLECLEDLPPERVFDAATPLLDAPAEVAP